VVPTVSKSRMGGRAFSYQAPPLLNQMPVWVQEASLLLRLGLKLFFLIKLVVRDCSSDPETSLSYIAIGLDCLGTSYDVRFYMTKPPQRSRPIADELRDFSVT